MRVAFTHLRKRAQESQLAKQFTQQQAKKILTTSFTIWRRKAALQSAERIVTHQHNLRVAQKTIAHWRLAAFRQHQADTFRNMNLQRVALARFKKSRRKARVGFRRCICWSLTALATRPGSPALCRGP